MRSGNVWGVNVDGLLACDEFRIALLLSLGVVPKVIRFSDSVRRALLNVATELTPHFSARLLAKLAAAC